MSIVIQSKTSSQTKQNTPHTYTVFTQKILQQLGNTETNFDTRNQKVVAPY